MPALVEESLSYAEAHVDAGAEAEVVAGGVAGGVEFVGAFENLRIMLWLNDRALRPRHAVDELVDREFTLQTGIWCANTRVGSECWGTRFR
jgi:hypothetical protein